MATAPPSSISYVVMDASTLIALCAKEPGRYERAYTETIALAGTGSLFYAPNVIVGES